MSTNIGRLEGGRVNHIDLAVLQQELRTFAAKRDWEQFHSIRNLVLALAGEVGELASDLHLPKARATPSNKKMWKPKRWELRLHFQTARATKQAS
jgi:hypothetical protein